MLYDKKWDKELEVVTEPWRQRLLEAAALLVKEGHTKGCYQDRTGARCALGAIWKVDSNKPVPTIESDPVGNEAVRKLQQFLRKHGGTSISSWNDTGVSSAEEVIQTLRDVARS